MCMGYMGMNEDVLRVKEIELKGKIRDTGYGGMNGDAWVFAVSSQIFLLQFSFLVIFWYFCIPCYLFVIFYFLSVFVP